MLLLLQRAVGINFLTMVSSLTLSVKYCSIIKACKSQRDSKKEEILERSEGEMAFFISIKIT